jgi:hypothetical protein
MYLDHGKMRSFYIFLSFNLLRVDKVSKDVKKLALKNMNLEFFIVCLVYGEAQRLFNEIKTNFIFLPNITRAGKKMMSVWDEWREKKYLLKYHL